MNLDWSEEQQVLRDMVRGLCAEYCPTQVVRAMEDDPKGYPDDFWKQLCELGLVGMLVPEKFGGGGQGMLEAVIAYEELGRALAPTPAFHSGVVCAEALLAAASEAEQQHWLPRIASGEVVLTPAWLEPQGGFGPRGVQLRAEQQGDSWLLTGEKRHVAFAAGADALLVLARTGAQPQDISLFLVDPGEDAVSMQQMKSLASDTQYDVQFDGARAQRVGGEHSGRCFFDTVMYDALIVLAAFALGGCERAHEITTEYAGERKQFDKPIGAFQAIAHYLADAITRIDGGKVLVYEAAWARDQGRDTRRLAPMAKLFACDTYRDTTAMCEQVWGGVGFTQEYDIQLFFRRAKQLQITWWDAKYLEALVAADVLDR